MVSSELNIPHDLITVDITTCENYDPDYAKYINPNMVVPSLVDMDGSTVVTDSKVIIETLVEKYTGTFNKTDLRPSTGVQETISKEWLKRMDVLDIETISMGSGKYVPPIVSDLRYAKALRITKYYAEKFSQFDPSLSKLYRIRYEKALKSSKKSHSQQEYNIALQRLNSDLNDMETLLSDGRTWFCGSNLTLVDVAWAPVFRRLDDIGYTDKLVTSALPNVQRYASNLKQRPSYISAIDGFPPPLNSPMKKAQTIGNLAYDRLFGGKEAYIMTGTVLVGGITVAVSILRKKNF